MSRIPISRIFPFLTNLFLAAFFATALAFFVYHLYYQQKVIPGVYILGVNNLSNLTEPQAKEKINNKFQAYGRGEVVLDFDSKKVTRPFSDFGLFFDATGSARRAFAVGRSGSLLADLKQELEGLTGGLAVAPVYSLNRNLWNQTLSDINRQLVGENARFEFAQGLYIVPETMGFKINPNDLEKRILPALLSLSNPIDVQLEPYMPRLTSSDLRSHFDEVQKLLAQRPSLFYDSKFFSLSEKDFLSFLIIVKNEPLKVDLEKAKDFVQKITTGIDRPSKALSFAVEGKTIKNFSPGQDGLIVSVDQTSQKLSTALLSGKSETVEIVVKRTKAEVTNNQLGIRQLIGEGVSNFSGSIPGRIKNIKRASSQLNGILIEPGGVFSFDQSVGEISAETGYDYAYIISEGRTVLGTGGGVCQVSTTVFRAALNAGLPILKRTAHAYRVHYYEQGSAVGFDATVFPPEVDFQFKNDTPGYLLMTTEVEGEELRVNLYGQDDGRRVTIIGPKILSASPAPAPLFQDDPTLPVGVKKQIDFAADGAVVVFERKVTRAGAILLDDTFTSNYRPWQAIYLIGTKT